MSKFKVVGLRKVNFTDKSTNAVINGTTVYCTRQVDGVLGVEGKKYFIKGSIDLSKVSLNDDIDIVFNDLGKVEAVSILK